MQEDELVTRLVTDFLYRLEQVKRSHDINPFWGAIDDTLIRLLFDLDGDRIDVDDFDREVKRLREKLLKGKLARK
jgi:hypothetical protein